MTADEARPAVGLGRIGGPSGRAGAIADFLFFFFFIAVYKTTIKGESPAQCFRNAR